MGVNRTPVYTAVLPQVLGSGLQPDLHDLQKILWSEAENVSFRNGRIRRRKPTTQLFDAGANAIRGIGQHSDGNGVRWIWAGSGADVVRWFGTTVDAIYSAASWVEDQTVNEHASFWDFLPYGEWMILNNGVGQPQVWKPAPSIGALGDVPSDVVVMMKKLNFLLAIGYGGAKTRVGWSNGDVIDVWTAAADNIAGSLTIAEFNTPIRAACELGAGIAMYSEDQMAVLNYVGAPFYFGYSFKLDGIGAVGKRAVVSDGKNNIGVGRNGVWWTDGISHRYIDEGPISVYFQENVNWDQSSKIVAARNDVTGCYDFCFPMGANLAPTEAWSYDPRVGAWYEIPVFSYKDERRLFRRPLVGTLTGEIELDEDDSTGNPLVLKTRPLLPQVQDETGLRDVHHNCHVHEVDLLLKEATAVEWRIGSCQEPAGVYTYTDYIAAEVGATTIPVPRGLPSGVYHKLEFRSTADDWALDLQGFMLFGQIEGTKRVAA